MSWPLKEITLEEYDAKTDLEIAPGTFWRIPLDHRYGEGASYGGATYREAWSDWLSPEFEATGRDYVIMVMLPRGSFCIDHRASDSPSGWTVTGELPDITATPSINWNGIYHGWIQNGVLTDDCEGRTFPPYDGQKT